MVVSSHNHGESSAAGGPSIELVVDFVNTADLDRGTEQLESPEALRSWLADRGLLAADATARADDLIAARSLREALRALMLENNDGPAAPEEAAAELERAARRGELSVRFGAGGSMRIEPCATGMDGALASLLAAVAAAIGDGSWQRVKACRAENCRWAFYDRSRNRSGVWCDMAVCGNREKVRAYRERSG